MEVLKANGALALRYLKELLEEYWLACNGELSDDETLRLGAKCALSFLDPAVNALVLVDEDRPQGFMVVEFKGSEDQLIVHVRDLYVRPDADAKGLLKLVQSFIRVAQGANAGLVTATIGKGNERWAEILKDHYGFTTSSVELELETEKYNGREQSRERVETVGEVWA